MSEEEKKLKEINTKLSKALAEEMASNFSQAHLRANLEEKLEKIKELPTYTRNSHRFVSKDDLKEILKEEKSWQAVQTTKIEETTWK